MRLRRVGSYLSEPGLRSGDVTFRSAEVAVLCVGGGLLYIDYELTFFPGQTACGDRGWWTAEAERETR